MLDVRVLAPAALAALAAACIAATLAAIALHQSSDTGFIAVTLLQAAIALLAAALAMRNPGVLTALIVFGGALALRAILLVEPPLLSDDIYRYIWDGRVINAGFNPFSHVPADPVLAPLRDDAIYAHVDKKDYAVTIYPPVAQAIFAMVTRLSDSLLAMKLAMLAFEAVAVAAMWSLLPKLGKSPMLVTAYLWHPAPIWEIANNGHVDAAMMALALAGFAWGMAAERPKSGRQNWRAGLLIAAGALAKPWGALWLPAVWRPFDVKLPLVVIAFVGLCYLPFASAGTNIFGFLGIYLKEQGLDTGAGFYLVGVAKQFGAPDWVRDVYLAGAGLVLAGLAIGMALRPNRSPQMRLGEAAVLTITFLFVLTPVYPWYFLIAAPFVPLTGAWSAFAMITSGFWLYSFNPDQIEFSHRWGLSLLVIAVCGCIDIWRMRFAPALVESSE